MDQTEKIYHNLSKKLHELRQWGKILSLATGILFSLALIIGAGFVLIVQEALYRFSTQIRTAIVIGLLTFGIITIGWFVAKPLFSLLFKKNSPDDDSLALKVGRKFPQIKDRLADSLQVVRSQATKNYGTSTSLALKSLRNIYSEVNPLDFRQAVSRKKLYYSMKIVGLVVIVSALGFGLFPRTVESAFERISHPGKPFLLPPPFQLFLHPGNIKVVQGEDVEISVESKGESPSKISLFLQVEGRTYRRILQKPFSYRITSIRKSLEYFAAAGKVKTSTFKIEVVQRPLVKKLLVKLFPPLYSHLGTREQEPNAGDIEALKGTKVEISAVTNKVISSAFLVFEKEKRKRMSIHGQEAGGSFIVKKEDRYRIELKDTLGLVNSDPISYTIKVVPDLEPVARILSPGKQVDLDESMTLPLTLEGEDDFGLLRCGLCYWIHKGGTLDSSEKEPGLIPINLKEKEPEKILMDYTWNMNKLGLFPEDLVSYCFEVWDNDRVSGPKRARSEIFTVRFPSISEIFQEVEEEQSNQVESLSEIYNESENLREELERISEDIKAGKKLEWEEKKNLGEIGEKQKRMETKVDSLKERLDNIIEKMKRNELLSPETLAKYQELQKLYQEVSSPELREALKKLQETMNQISKDELKKALENFKFSQESFLKSIERTISLLKRLQIEQKVDELVRRTEDLIERQKEINRELSEMSEETRSDLARREKKIAEDTKELRNEMEKLFQKMEKLPGMPLAKLEAAIDMMDRKNLAGELKRTETMIRAGNTSNAQAAGAKAQKTMSFLAEMLKEMQKTLKENQKKKIARALRRASRRLLQLSKGEENLIEGEKGGKISESSAAETQLSLLSGLRQVADSLVQLSHKTFFVTPEMGRALGEAQAQMNKALQKMEQTGGKVASQYQRNAMGSLNQTVLAIENALGKLSGASSGLGMEEFLLGLEKLSQQQMAINQQTMDLFNKGRLTLAEQAALTRLAREQQAVQKALSELLKEFGNRSEIIGNLDQMVKDMEEVVKELKQNNVSQETVQQQERILSRLLDAQRSVHRRDYSRKRLAKVGRNVVRKSPGPLRFTRSLLRDRLRRDILQMPKEGYTKEYQELIRKYFDALAKEEKR